MIFWITTHAEPDSRLKIKARNFLSLLFELVSLGIRDQEVKTIEVERGD